MLTKLPQPVHPKVPRRDQTSSKLDPAALGATLRELALRAYELVSALDLSDIDAPAHEQALREVHGRIVSLQRNLEAYRLDDLAAYVTALRERVEERLG